MELSLFIIYRIDGTRMKEKKDPATLEAFFSLSFFSFSSSITCAFPLPIKGKAGRPYHGTEQEKANQNTRARHEHIAK